MNNNNNTTINELSNADREIENKSSEPINEQLTTLNPDNNTSKEILEVTLLNKKRDRSPEPFLKASSESISREIIDPDYNIPLVSIELFTELQPYKQFTEEEITQSYREYKSKHYLNLSSTFFKEHKDDEWFKEQFNPHNYYEHKEIIKSQIHRLSSYFISKIDTYSDISLTLTKEDEYDNKIYTIIETPFIPNDSKENEDKEKNQRKECNGESIEEHINPVNKYHFFNPNHNALFVQRIPTFISMNQLMNEAKKAPGLLAITLSDPIKKGNYGRYCWFTYDNEANCKNASEVLKEISFDNYVLLSTLSVSLESNYKIRVTVPLYSERIKEDLHNAMKIIALYSLYYELNEQELFNLLDSNESCYSIETKLDIMILYLRKVLGFCYYCIKDYKNERNVIMKCGYAHLRSSNVIESREGADQLSISYINDAYFTKVIGEFILKGLNDTIKTSVRYIYVYYRIINKGMK